MDRDAASITINRHRLDDLADRVRSESLNEDELRHALGDVPAEDIRQRRDERQLLGVEPAPGEPLRDPRWQLSAEGAVRPGVDRLLTAAADARMSNLALHLRMTATDGLNPGRPLAASLDDRMDEVIEVVRASCAHGG